VQFVLGLLAAVAAFVWAFRGVDLPALVRALRAAQPGWLVLAVLSVSLSLMAVVARWWCLLDRPAARLSGRPTWLVLVSSTLAAQMANIVMPFRLGDGVRLVAAGHTLGLGPARAASSAVLERVGDVVALGGVCAGVMASNATPVWARAAITRSSRLAAGVAVAAVIVFALAAWAVAWSAAVPATSALTNVLVMRAFGLPAPWMAAVLLMVVLQVGTSIVTVPGGLGVSQLLTVKTLGLYDVAPADALAFSLVLYLVANVPKLIALPVVMTWAGRSTVEAGR
jgi:uncharacterized membrane protein YbhN (UPF0104 family)